MSLVNDLPTVTILLSNYNGYPYLHTSLEGMCNQTHPADEIIIIDDGSKDKSLETIQEYSQKYKNIKILINEENKGLLYSINRALKESKSDYIVWAASDDYLLPCFLERSLNILKDHPKAGICFSQFAIFIDGTSQKRIYSKEVMGEAFDLGIEPHFLTPEMFYQRLQRSYLWMSGNTVLAHREALLEMGGFLSPLRWHADWFSFLVLAMRYGVCIVPEVLTFMREMPVSYSRTGIKNKKQQSHLLSEMLLLTEDKNFKDIHTFFQNCPCIFTPFGNDILFAMLKMKRFSLAYKYCKFKKKNITLPRLLLFITRKFYKIFLNLFSKLTKILFISSKMKVVK